MKEDRDSVLLEIAVAPGVGFGELNAGIRRFGHGVVMRCLV